MASVLSSTVPTAPGAPVAADHAPATPTPSIKTAYNSISDPTRSSLSLQDPRPSQLPEAKSGLVSQQIFRSGKSEVPETVTTNALSPESETINQPSVDALFTDKLPESHGSIVGNGLGPNPAPIAEPTMRTSQLLTSSLETLVQDITSPSFPDAPKVLGSGLTAVIDSSGPDMTLSLVSSQNVQAATSLALGDSAATRFGAISSLPVVSDPADESNEVASTSSSDSAHEADTQSSEESPKTEVIDGMPVQIGGPSSSNDGNPPHSAQSGPTNTADHQGIEIEGTQMSLQPSSDTILGEDTIPSTGSVLGPGFSTRTAAISKAGSVLNLGAHTFPADPTAVFIAGSTIVAGGSGVTIKGTAVRLDTLGGLVIGESTIPILPTLTSPTTDLSFSTDAATATTSYAHASLSGTVIISGGAEITVGGTLISVEASAEASTGDSRTMATPGSQNPVITPSVSKGSAERRFRPSINAIGSILLTLSVFGVIP